MNPYQGTNVQVVHAEIFPNIYKRHKRFIERQCSAELGGSVERDPHQNGVVEVDSSKLRRGEGVHHSKSSPHVHYIDFRHVNPSSEYFVIGYCTSHVVSQDIRVQSWPRMMLTLVPMFVTIERILASLTVQGFEWNERESNRKFPFHCDWKQTNHEI